MPIELLNPAHASIYYYIFFSGLGKINTRIQCSNNTVSYLSLWGGGLAAALSVAQTLYCHCMRWPLFAVLCECHCWSYRS